MNCWKCKRKLDLPSKKISFRIACDFCNADLHVCKNCKYYAPEKPNCCSIPNSLHVSDREKFNFCEDFALADSVKPEKNNQSNTMLKKVFGDQAVPQKKDFRTLFPEN